MYINVTVWINRKGEGYGWKPSSSSNSSVRAFRACPLIEVGQAVPCREIRGSSISMHSTLPPLLEFEAGGVRPNSVGSSGGICLAAAPHYRTRTLSKRLPKAKQKPLRDWLQVLGLDLAAQGRDLPGP